MQSNFKIDIKNNTSQDIDFVLFGEEKVVKPPVSTVIPMPSYPLGAVYNPSNGYTYRTRFNDSIVVTDAENNIVATIPGVDISGNEGVYNSFNQTVYFPTFVNKIIAINGLVLTTIPTPGVPNFPVFCPLNNSVYFSNSDFSATRLFKVAPNNTLSFINVPGEPVGQLQGSKGIFFPADNTILYGSNSTNKIYVFDPVTDTYVTFIPTVSRAFEPVLFPTTDKVYYSSYEEEIYVIDSGNVLNTLNLPAGQRATYGAYSESENILYFVSEITQQFLYAIDPADSITAIPLDFPTEIIYNIVDQKIYVSTTTTLEIVKDKAIQQSIPIGFIDYPVLNTDIGTVNYSMPSPYGLFFYGNANLDVPTAQIDFINNEVNSGAYKIEELKIISSDLQQFSYPIHLIQKTMTGRSVIEPIFPLDRFGSFFWQNVVTLKAKDLGNFTASISNSIRTTVKANTALSLMFKGNLVKPGDKLTNKKKLEYYE